MGCQSFLSVLLCLLDAGDGFERQHHSVYPLDGSFVSSSPSFPFSIPLHTHSQYPPSHARSPVTHMGQELNWDIPAFALPLASHSPTGFPRGRWGSKRTHRLGTRLKQRGLTPLALSSCLPPALGCPGFYPEFGQGMRARARKTSWCILPWAVREPGGAEVPVCLRCKQVLLICCLFVFL